MLNVAVADFNGDGKLDVAAVDSRTAWCRSSTALATAPSTWEQPTIPTKAIPNRGVLSPATLIMTSTLTSRL